MKKIVVTFKSGRHTIFDMPLNEWDYINSLMLKVIDQTQFLILNNSVINLYEIECIEVK